MKTVLRFVIASIPSGLMLGIVLYFYMVPKPAATWNLPALVSVLVVISVLPFVLMYAGRPREQ